MIDQELTPEYLQAFQDGYLLAKHEPDLAKLVAKQLESINFSGPNGSGFKDGLAQAEIDKGYDRLPERFRQNVTADKNQELEKQRGQDKDLTLDEPDIDKD